MPCFHPISAFYPLDTDTDGKRRLLFGRKRFTEIFMSSTIIKSRHLNIPKKTVDAIENSSYDYPIYIDSGCSPYGLDIKVPCGKCIGCKLDYSRMWATRSVHEAFMHDYYKDCSFVTLTFNSDMLLRRENPYSINKTAFRSWIKRLRRAIEYKYGKTIRLMACGEYGARHKRPHYHMIIYGFNFPDKYIWKYNKIHGQDIIYYRSPFLEEVWTPAGSSDSFGFSVIGLVNFETSAYVARYVTKKLFGKFAEKTYKEIEPEFLTTSRNPGLGYNYFEKYYKDMFNYGYVTLPNGFKAPIPRYYSNKLETLNPDLYSKWSIDKRDKMIENLFIENLDSTHQRLFVREELKKYNLNVLHRQYEFDTSQEAT